jgi:hypothetical protein
MGSGVRFPEGQPHTCLTTNCGQCIIKLCIAQPGSALVWGTRGRRFEPCYRDQSCPGGGIGRRTGLKIRRETVRVRVPPWAPTKYSRATHEKAQS